ncbi:DsbA family protein [Fructilactobacillus frigidiflavus]|uniref:DsbA family protein n=1 Tax=Fructilactobacillus frigidiflavus TaxID=3242688 RepID=UPI003757CD65
MLEVYLFVNPACSKCLNSEQTVTKVTDELDCKVCLRFIPFINLSSINEANQLNLDSYQMTIDYKAALYQGCKKGRQFLQLIQELTLIKKEAYTEELVKQAALAVNLDLEMFQEDRESAMVKKNIVADQKLVQEMGISDHGSLVMFDCHSSEHGLLVEKINDTQLADLFKGVIKRDSFEDFKAMPNLRVL